MTKKTGNSYLHPWASAFLFSDGSKPANWYDSEKHCKDAKFSGIYIALSPKKIKITFHAACETTFWARNGRNVSKNLEVKRKMSIFASSEFTTLPVRTAYQGGTFLFIATMKYNKQPLDIPHR